VPRRRFLLTLPAPALEAGLQQLRAELKVPAGFPPEVEEEARAAAAAEPALDGRLDVTDVPFVTIDPPGSRDLDQAFHAERCGDGYRVRYAIADVAAFVAPGGALDVEAHRRGQTLYCPDCRTPLYPTVLSEGAASLLAAVERPALLWTIDLDARGAQTAVSVARACVRNRAQLDYAAVQAALDAGQADEPLALLREIGELRLALERERGGVSLPLPAHEVEIADGGYRLAFRLPLPVEQWNAQISLLTGMAAAELMLQAGAGLLRTVPPPDPEAIEELRHLAASLHVPWPEGTRYSDFISSLDASKPEHAALLTLATRVLRGATYRAFDGEPPPDAEHHALAAPYAHVTAPLRRLADRYASELALAAAGGREPEAWATKGLAQLPRLMADGDRRAGVLERSVVDLVEASVLEPRIGDRFRATVLSTRQAESRVQVLEPAVRAPCRGPGLSPGATVLARLAVADPATRKVEFEADGAGAAQPSRPSA
jgi:exoribonuclease R